MGDTNQSSADPTEASGESGQSRGGETSSRSRETTRETGHSVTGASRRDLLRAAVGSVGVAAVTGVGSRGHVAAEETALLDEGFETYETGSYPSDWTKAGNSDQEVVDSTAAEGSKCLRISGSPGGCWEALADAPVAVGDANRLTVSGSVKPTSNGEVGCHDGKRGAVGLRTETGSWSAGKGTRLVKFHTDGTVRGVGGEYGSYDIDEWNSFEVTYHQRETEVELTYTINGEQRGSGRRAVAAFEDDLSYVRFGSGDFTVFYDDLYAAAVDRPDAPTVETRDTTGDGLEDVRVANSEIWLLIEGADEDGRVYTSRIGQFGDAALGTDYDFKPTTRDDQLSHQSTEPVETFQTEAGAGYHLRRQFELSGVSFGTETTVYLPSDRRSALARVRFSNEGSQQLLLDQDRGNIHDGVMVTRGTPLADYGPNYRFHVTGSGTHSFDDAGLWSTFDLSGSLPTVVAFDDENAISYGLVDGASGPRHAVTNGDPVQRVDMMAKQQTLDPGDTASYTLALGVHDGGDDTPSRALDELSTVAARTDEIPAPPDGGLPPSAAITVSSESVGIGDDVTFDASGSTDEDGSITTYEWDFDGDGTTDATGETVTHAFSETGEHTVSVTVSDERGGTDTAQTVVTVTSPTDDRVFTFTDGAEGWTFGMRNASRSTPGEGEWSERADGSLHLSVSGAPSTVQAWREVGPLSAGTTISATYEPTRFEYAAAGVSLRLYVPSETRTIQLDKDSDNESGDYEQDGRLSGTVPENLPAETQVELHLVIWPGDTEVWVDRVSVGAETTPTASFDSSPTDPTVGEQVSFDAGDSTAPAGEIKSYEWDFDGDGETDATGETVTHTFDSTGEYAVKLQVVDDSGATASTETTVSVAPNPEPEPSFTVSPDGPRAGDRVTFDASPSSDPDGTVTRYEWDFDGDGTTDATGETVTHTFERPGEYDVTITVVDDTGTTATNTRQLAVDRRLADLRAEKLAVADRVDAASVVTEFGWVDAGIGDRPLAASTVARWESALAEGNADRSVAEEAVDRLRAAETATAAAMEFVSPDGDAGHNFARRLAENATRVVVDLLLMKLSIGHRLLSFAPSWAKGTIRDVAETVIDDALTSSISAFLDIDGAKTETRRTASSGVTDVWQDVVSGARDLSSALSGVIESVMDVITQGVRASIEFFTITPVSMANPPNSIRDLVMGNSLWATTLDLHDRLSPFAVDGSLPGSTETARRAATDAVETMDSRLDTVGDNLDALNRVVGDLGVVESARDVASMPGPAGFTWELAQTAIQVVSDLAGIVVDATAAVSAGLAVWQIRKLHEEVVVSTLTGTDEVSGWTPL